MPVQGGGGAPLRFSADSEKKLRAARVFGYLMGQTLRNFWQKKN